MMLLRRLHFLKRNESACLCPVCQNVIYRYRIQNGFKLLVCNQCGLIFWNNNFEGIDELFKINSLPEERPHEGELCSLRWGQTLFLKKEYTNSKSLLDFGCGNGNFLAACLRNNIQAIGCEASDNLLKFCKQNNQIVFPNTLNLKSSSLDFITMWEVIEHISHPVKVFDDLKRIIKPGGKLILSTPNFRHPAVSKTKLIRYWPPYHVTFWDKRSLLYFLHNQGFKILNIYYRPFQWSILKQHNLKKTLHEIYLIGMEIVIIAQKI